MLSNLWLCRAMKYWKWSLEKVITNDFHKRQILIYFKWGYSQILLTSCFVRVVDHHTLMIDFHLDRFPSSFRIPSLIQFFSHIFLSVGWCLLVKPAHTPPCFLTLTPEFKLLISRLSAPEHSLWPSLFGCLADILGRWCDGLSTVRWCWPPL